MRYTPSLYYHFDPFYSNRIVDYKVKFLNFASKFKKYFSVLHISTGIVTGLNKDLGKLYLMVEGLKTVVTDIDIEAARIEYPIIKKSLTKFSRLYHMLEQVDFLTSPETKRLSENILLEFYSLESQMRCIIHEETKSPSFDQELLKNASLVSLNTIQSLNAS